MKFKIMCANFPGVWCVSSAETLEEALVIARECAEKAIPYENYFVENSSTGEKWYVN